MIKAFAAVVILAFVGCSEPVGPHVDGMEVTISLSQEVMAVGDTIEIHVVATNTTTGEVSFATNACILVVQVVDQSNTPVVYLPGSCNDIRLEHTLGPGESLSEVALFDGTDRTYPLEPGPYMVFAGISSDLLNPSEGVELRIVSDG